MHYGYDNPERLYKISGKETEPSSPERNLEILIHDDFKWDANVAKVTKTKKASLK